MTVGAILGLIGVDDRRLRCSSAAWSAHCWPSGALLLAIAWTFGVTTVDDRQPEPALECVRHRSRRGRNRFRGARPRSLPTGRPRAKAATAAQAVRGPLCCNAGRGNLTAGSQRPPPPSTERLFTDFKRASRAGVRCGDRRPALSPEHAGRLPRRRCYLLDRDRAIDRSPPPLAPSSTTSWSGSRPACRGFVLVLALAAAGHAGCRRRCQSSVRFNENLIELQAEGVEAVHLGGAPPERLRFLFLDDRLACVATPEEAERPPRSSC